MADPITAAIAAIGAAVGGTTGAFLIIYSTQLAMAALVLGSTAVANHQRRKAKQKARDAYNASLQDRLVMVATVDGARSRLYGSPRNVDGVLFKATRGSNSEFYTLIVALAGHEVEAIDDVYFNDSLVALDGSGYVQTAPWAQTVRRTGSANLSVSGGNGSVTLPYTPVADSVTVVFPINADQGDYVPPFSVLGTLVTVTGSTGDGVFIVSYQYDEQRAYARVRKYLGAASQDISADLVADFPSLCTSTDKFRGIALLRVDLEYSQDAFPTGVPQVSAVVRGARVYDARSATTAWTRNPALIARDWSLYAYGGGLPESAFSTSTASIAANVCDVDSAFASPSGTVVMDTYQCDMVCKLDQDPSAQLGEMVEAMAGRWGFSGGELRLMAGSYRAPVATITEDWITDASQILITPLPPRSELVNAYRPSISNRLNKYQVEPVPPVIASAYVTADGQQLDAEITMAAVTHPLHAQHIAGVLLREARQSLTVQLPCNLRAFKLELFDVVAVTLARFGWSAKVFEVLGWRFTIDGGVLLTLKEHAAATYTPDVGFADLGDDDNTELPNLTEVPQVAGVTVTSGTTPLTDGSVLVRAEVSWTLVTDASITQAGRVEVQYVQANAAVPTGEWPGQLESGSAGKAVINGLLAGRVYLFRLRAINVAGVRGRWSLHVAHRVAAAPVTLTRLSTVAAGPFVEGADAMASQAFTLTEVSDVLVTCTYTVTCTNGEGSTKNIWTVPRVNLDGAYYASTSHYFPNVANGALVNASGVVQQLFEDVAAGSHYAALKGGVNEGTWLPMNYQNVTTVVEIVR